MRISGDSGVLNIANGAKAVLRSDITRISLLLIGLTVFANLFSLLFGYLFAAGALFAVMPKQPFSFALLGHLVSELSVTPVGNFVVGYLPAIAADVVIILFAKKLLSFPIQPPLFGKLSHKPFLTLWGALSCSGMSVFGLIGTSLIIGLFSLFELEVLGPDFTLVESDPFSNGMVLLYACILAPIMEEILFRGYILNRLRRHGNLFAVLASSLLFAMFHANLIQFFVPFFLGILLSFLTIESGSILPAVIAHAVNNIMAFAMGYIENETVYTVAYVVYLLVGLFALLMLCRRYKSSIRRLFTGQNGYLSGGQKLLCVISAPLFLVYLLIYLAGIVVLFWIA